MRASEHIGNTELLLAIDHEVSVRQQEAIDAHLATCASCRQRWSALHLADACAAPLTDAGRAAEHEVSPAARARLSTALRAAGAAPGSWWARAARAVGAPPALFPVAGVAAVAATVLLLVAPAVRRGPVGNAPLPDASLTPGAVSALTALELCGGARPSRVVTLLSRQTVLRSYQMEQVSDDLFELDALVTPELGGTTDPGNLWPQRYAAPIWNASVKDQLELLLPELVCSDRVELSVAQHEIATDWIAAYKKYFRTDVPLTRDATNAVDDDELIVEEVVPPWRSARTGVGAIDARSVHAPLFIVAPHASLTLGLRYRNLSAG